MSYDFIYVICKVGHLFLFFCFFCYARSVGKEWKTTGTTIKTRKSSCLASEQSTSGLSSSTSEAAKPSGQSCLFKKMTPNAH